MDKIICFCGGLLLGAAVCLALTMHSRPMDKALVLQARRHVMSVANLPDDERNAYIQRVSHDPRLHTTWHIAVLLNNEFGGVYINRATGRRLWRKFTKDVQKNCTH